MYSTLMHSLFILFRKFFVSAFVKQCRFCLHKRQFVRFGEVTVLVRCNFEIIPAKNENKITYLLIRVILLVTNSFFFLNIV